MINKINNKYKVMQRIQPYWKHKIALILQKVTLLLILNNFLILTIKIYFKQ